MGNNALRKLQWVAVVQVRCWRCRRTSKCGQVDEELVMEACVQVLLEMTREGSNKKPQRIYFLLFRGSLLEADITAARLAGFWNTMSELIGIIPMSHLRFYYAILSRNYIRPTKLPYASACVAAATNRVTIMASSDSDDNILTSSLFLVRSMTSLSSV